MCLYYLCLSRINDGLVGKANEHGEGSEEGKPYLFWLISASAVLYAASLCAIGAMFHYFRGCPANELVMSLTLIASVVRSAFCQKRKKGCCFWNMFLVRKCVFYCCRLLRILARQRMTRVRPAVRGYSVARGGPPRVRGGRTARCCPPSHEALHVDGFYFGAAMNTRMAVSCKPIARSVLR